MMIGKEILYLSREDVQKVGMPMKECVDVLEGAHRAKSRGEVEMPEKPHLGGMQSSGFLEAFPARIPGDNSLGLKWLGGCRNNPAIGLPTVTGLIVVNDPDTWCPVAIMDCTYITGLRTAAMAGIVIRHLAKPHSEVVTVLGCGLQGRTHLEAAVCEMPDLRKVYAWGPRADTVKRFASEMKETLGVDVTPIAEPETAVREADVLLSSTPFGAPDEYRMIRTDWLKPGLTVTPASQASHFFPDAFFAFDKYYVDDEPMISSVLQREGMPGLPPRPLWEIGDYLEGKRPGRENGDERIFEYTNGVAINDIAVGKRVYERALARGIGTMLPL